jgi:hypothetical protein
VVTTREFKRLAVEVRNVDRPFQLKPARVNLTVRGPQRVVQSLTLDEGRRLRGRREPTSRGSTSSKAEVTLPAWVEVVKRDPPVIRLEILEDSKNGVRK